MLFDHQEARGQGQFSWSWDPALLRRLQKTLNNLTKADTFPLPRMYDIIDQLGESKFFSTLNLKSGYGKLGYILTLKKRLLL